ncbi:MAG: hypothetical protein GY754_09025 [bacterium]|nr:hypothetical protein [bacterium]
MLNRKKLNKLVITIITGSLLILSCGHGEECPADRTIPDSGLLDYGTNTYKLWLPYNFENEVNCRRRYPLVIALHGSTTLTDHYYQPCIVGYNDEVQKKAYPSVYFAPNNTNIGFSTNAVWIRELINTIIKNKSYQIDTNRIYIIGFSMGAHGTTYMAQDLYDDYGYIVAGIIPAGGGIYNYITATQVLNKTSMWFHYGSEDYDQESDYIAAKEYNYTAEESVKNGSITYTSWDQTVYTYPHETKTLTRNGVALFKITRYLGMGHTAAPVYEDPEVLKWLFNQSLENR